MSPAGPPVRTMSPDGPARPKELGPIKFRGQTNSLLSHQMMVAKDTSAPKTPQPKPPVMAPLSRPPESTLKTFAALEEEVVTASSSNKAIDAVGDWVSKGGRMSSEELSSLCDAKIFYAPIDKAKVLQACAGALTADTTEAEFDALLSEHGAGVISWDRENLDKAFAGTKKNNAKQISQEPNGARPSSPSGPAAASAPAASASAPGSTPAAAPLGPPTSPPPKGPMRSPDGKIMVKPKNER